MQDVTDDDKQTETEGKYVSLIKVSVLTYQDANPICEFMITDCQSPSKRLNTVQTSTILFRPVVVGLRAQ